MVLRVKFGASLPISGQELGAHAVIIRAANITIVDITSNTFFISAFISANHPAHTLHTSGSWTEIRNHPSSRLFIADKCSLI
jgi:hypothetical protein